jgi:amino acid transporter
MIVLLRRSVSGFGGRLVGAGLLVVVDMVAVGVLLLRWEGGWRRRFIRRGLVSVVVVVLVVVLVLVVVVGMGAGGALLLAWWGARGGGSRRVWRGRGLLSWLRRLWRGRRGLGRVVVRVRVMVRVLVLVLLVRVARSRSKFGPGAVSMKVVEQAELHIVKSSRWASPTEFGSV